MSAEKFNTQPQMPEFIPMIPMGGKEAVPSLTEEQYARHSELVKRFPNLVPGSPEYVELEQLQGVVDEDAKKAA